MMTVPSESRSPARWIWIGAAGNVAGCTLMTLGVKKYDEIHVAILLTFSLAVLGTIGGVLRPNLILNAVIISGASFVGFLGITLVVALRYDYPAEKMAPAAMYGGALAGVNFAVVEVANLVSHAIRRRISRGS